MYLSDRIIHTIRQVDRSIRARGFLFTSRLAIRVLWQEGFRGVRSRLDALGPALRTQKIKNGTVILTMPHTIHFARRLRGILEECGIESQISDTDRTARGASLVFAFAPQNFPAIPYDRTIAFQVEQHIAKERWTSEYLSVLAKCRGVCDFSIRNIESMRDIVPFQKIYHVPFWPLARFKNISNQKNRQDVIFYGDKSSPRRQRMLNDLRSALPDLKVESNLFGSDLEDALEEAEIVVNIHAKDNSLLETARISEALSFGCAVVSETACDAGGEVKDLAGLFLVPEGDVNAIVKAVEFLKKPGGRSALQINNAKNQPDNFRIGVLRALQGMQIISHELFDALAPEYPKAVVNAFDGACQRICLSLPESPARAREFLQKNKNSSGFHIWPGLKASPGWRGAALSYRRIFKELQENNIFEVLIVEDDVLLPDDFEKRLETIRAAMDRTGADMFSGLIVDLHEDARITGVESYDGVDFINLDRSVMMICNIYRKNMIEYLANWRPDDDNPFTNTIDRYMEMATHLNIMTTLPFTAKYRSQEKSTLRKSHNNSFDYLLKKSEANLALKVARFKSASDQ